MKFIFLDRDGVINKDPEGWAAYSYVTRWEDFYFLPGVLDALKELTEKKYKIAILSNQAGVGKGIYTEDALNEITKKMVEKIEKNGGKIYSVNYCIHKTEDNCDCKKPRTGLFKKAVKGLDVDFTDTYFVGDTQRDIEAGKKIGCKTILVMCGKTKNAKSAENWEFKPDLVKKDLEEAVKGIIRVNKGIQWKRE